jgi:hypothetical protein
MSIQPFYAQIYCFDQDGVLSLTEATEIAGATSHDQAAEMACGKGAVLAGPKEKLAAKVWRVAGGQPDIKLYYRP